MNIFNCECPAYKFFDDETNNRKKRAVERLQKMLEKAKLEEPKPENDHGEI